MGFFDFFRRAPGPPEWAAFFSLEEYGRFASTLRVALESRSLTISESHLRSGSVPIKVGSEDGSLGFGPIARKCRGLDPQTWPELINEHLDRALALKDDETARFRQDFEAARPFLKVQLMPDHFVRADWTEGLNFRTFGAGIKAALVYDLPTRVHSVPADDVRHWKRASAELFEIAAENVRAEAVQPAVEQVRMEEEDVVLKQLLGDSFFVCSHALWLGSHAEAVSDRGALVVVPSRHTILFHPICDASAWRALSALPFMAADLHSKLPGPVSANIFWLKDGQIIDVPVRRTGDAFQVMPPLALVNAINGSGSTP